MKKLQNSLYLNRDSLYAHKEREVIVIKEEKETLAKVPVHGVGNVYCFGQAKVSPSLMQHCCENDVNLAFFDMFGRYQARVQGRQSGNVLLRRAQFRRSERDPVSIARNIIAAKIQNGRAFLQRRLRNRGDNPALAQAIKSLAMSIERVQCCDDVELLRGLEGEAASCYFGVFQHLINPEQQEAFRFVGRNRRPPRDAVNALLSMIYGVIGQDVSGALQAVGLDPQIGFLHADRPGRDSLALDIMEEFRVYLADRLVLSLINRKQLSPKDFVTEVSGAVRIKDDSRKLIFTALQERKQEEILHPFLEKKVAIGLLPHIQAMLLARHLRGDLAQYPPFLAK